MVRLCFSGTGYSLVITGHSLGAGTAILCTILLFAGFPT